MKKVFTLIVLMMILPLLSVFAKDFGAMINQNISFSGEKETNDPEYNGSLFAWFAASLWENASFNIAASITANYEDEEWNAIPELMQTELSFPVGENGSAAVGRIPYSDPVGFIYNGLLDGASYYLGLENGSNFSIGAYYTGLLYKKNAHITMTPEDSIDYYTELDYDDFADTYFAPSRFIFSLNWNHPGIAELVRFQSAIIGQFDLSDNDVLFHSQYFTAKAVVPFNQFVFEAGAVIELSEEDDDVYFSFASVLGVDWMLPTSFADQLSFLWRFSSGTEDDGEHVIAFIPISTEAQGNILSEKLSGLSMLQLDYTVRLHETVSLSLTDSYFILSDLGTYQGWPFKRDGHFLGNEIYASALWIPVSDIQVNAGGGVFLPSMGDADNDADPFWRIDLSLVLAVY
jgi:hypothetical protein